LNELTENVERQDFGRTEAQTDNRRLAKKRVQWLNEASCFVSSFVVADSLMRRNQEPLRAKHPHLSGYSAFQSNPIKYSDLDGKDRIVAFSGANLFSESETKTAGHIIKTVDNYVLKNKIENIHTLAIATGLFEFQTNKDVIELGKKVDLLITVDAAAGWNSYESLWRKS